MGNIIFLNYYCRYVTDKIRCTKGVMFGNLIETTLLYNVYNIYILHLCMKHLLIFFQEDEIESLSSIFGEDWRVLTVNKMYCMDIHVNEPGDDVKLNDIVTLQVEYYLFYL